MTSTPTSTLPAVQRAVRWYPPSYDVRVEDDVALPQIEHPDDAIVRIKLGGLCGSDLHVYRGHEDVDSPCVCGHEFLGEVVALGASFGEKVDSAGRPALYATLKIGDKVLSPFTVSCGECYYCRAGFTCRCVHSALFGTPTLPGGQAQYIRVPRAGGTLYALDGAAMAGIAESSLLLLGDILPTGAFAALQALQHPKVQVALGGTPYAAAFGGAEAGANVASMTDLDRIPVFAVVGLGPVGLCAAISLLHLLAERRIIAHVVAVDLLPARRAKMEAMHAAIDARARGEGEFVVTDPDTSHEAVRRLSGGRACNAVLEVVGNNSALTLAHALVQPFGVISSVGVHQAPPLPFTGRAMYDTNVTLEFGRCPVRALFPLALEVLRARQDVFGSVGVEAGLVERIVPIGEAARWYKEFDKGRCGKVLFDPWA